MEWLAVGRVLSASEALERNLANRVVPEGEALAEATLLAEDIAAHDPEAVRSVKQLLRAGLTLAPEQALEEERSLFPALWAAPAHLEASTRFVSRKNGRGEKRVQSS